MMDEECFDEATLFSTFDAVKDAEEKVIISTRSKKNVHDTSSTELDSLKQENKLLKKVLRKIAPTSLQDDGNPVATIVYFDSPAFLREKRCDIEESIKHITCETDKHGGDKCDLNSSSSSENRSSFWQAFSLAHGKSGRLQQENEKLLECDFSSIPVGSVQYFSLFCLDSFGSSVVDLSPCQPSYERVYHKVLPNDGTAGVRQKRTCFNCDGDHKLQECQKPRDLVKINAKRQEFNEKFSSFGQEARYHADKMEKFKHLVPGKVSDNLRVALGLSGHDVPPFVYRMRMLGYPPGWLPGDQDSGIVMYGKEGKTEESNGEGKSSNPDQFVQFPGFNVLLPRGVKDLSREARLPQMSSHHMLAIHGDVSSPSETASRKHRHSSESNDNHHGSKRLRTSGSDMEIENDSPTRDPYRTSTPLGRRGNELEDGEIPSSPFFERTDLNLAGGVQEMGRSDKSDDGIPSWWLSEPLRSSGTKTNPELIPPPYPLKSLPLHKISQILPGEMNHMSFKDRILDPIFGNLQARTGRYDKLKTILAKREPKK